jgi:hypothetical protein
MSKLSFKILGKKRGGGGTSTTATIPEWAEPYIKNVLNAAEQAYGSGQLSGVAGLNANQQAAFGGGAEMISRAGVEGSAALQEQQRRMADIASNGGFDVSPYKQGIQNQMQQIANLTNQGGWLAKPVPQGAASGGIVGYQDGQFGLTAQSTPEQISSAYSSYISAHGGDTEANRHAAGQYLTGLGINQGTIDSAYQSFLGSQQPAASTPPPVNTPPPTNTFRAKTAGEGNLAYVNDFLKQNPNATDADVQGFASSAGLTFDPSKNLFSSDTGSFSVRRPVHYSSLTAASDPTQISRAYQNFVSQNGGDTLENQTAAKNWLSQLGISDDNISTAYKTYQTQNWADSLPRAPGAQPSGTVPPMPGSTTQPFQSGLTSSSNAQDISGAYQRFISDRGGDTVENRNAAGQYLINKGINQGTINSAYQSFLGNPYQSGLNATSSSAQIVDAYNRFIKDNGGDSEANRIAARDYLIAKGISPETIDKSYAEYKGGYNPYLQTAVNQEGRLLGHAQSGGYDPQGVVDAAVLEGGMRTADMGRQYGAQGVLGSARHHVQQGAQNAATTAAVAGIRQNAAQQNYQNKMAAEGMLGNNLGQQLGINQQDFNNRMAGTQLQSGLLGQQFGFDQQNFQNRMIGEQGIGQNVAGQSQLAGNTASGLANLGNQQRTGVQQQLDSAFQALQRYASTAYGNPARQQTVAGGK